jgi:hypothetical protein
VIGGLVAVEPPVFSAASSVMGQAVAGRLAEAAAGLGGGLAGSGAMAGSDPGGVAWATSYDQVTPVTAGALADLANACRQIGALLERTGFNHAAAEASSDPNHAGPTSPDATNYTAAPAVAAPTPPSADGGSSDPPEGWGLIESAVGYAWPNGDPGRLRDAGRAWTACANTLRGASGIVPEAVTAIQSQRSPEVADAVAVCQAMGRDIDDVAAGCDELAKGCHDYADHLDQAHIDVINALEELVAWTVAIEAAGALGSLISFGGAEVPAQIAEGGRIAATAAEVGGIISRLIEFADTVGRTVAGVAERIGQVAQRLRTILGARLSEVLTKLVNKIPGVGKNAGAAAEERLASEATEGTNVVSYADKVAARQAFEGDLRVTANRFFRDATSKSEGFKTSDLPGGGHRLQFFSPANNPGYGKLYVQELDASGAAIREYKDTLGPDGLIERKWIRGGPL